MLSFMEFHFLETVYTRFYLNEITPLFFINYLLYVIKKSYVATHLLKMKLVARLATPSAGLIFNK
jgi:hypothetical protein